MRSPDSSVLHQMRRGRVYSYLHYVYYKVGGAMHAITMATGHAPCPDMWVHIHCGMSVSMANMGLQSPWQRGYTVTMVARMHD